MGVAGLIWIHAAFSGTPPTKESSPTDIEALRDKVASLREANDSLSKGNAALQAKLASANSDAQNLRASLAAADDIAKRKYQSALRAENRELTEAQSLQSTALQAEPFQSSVQSDCFASGKRQALEAYFGSKPKRESEARAGNCAFG